MNRLSETVSRVGEGPRSVAYSLIIACLALAVFYAGYEYFNSNFGQSESSDSALDRASVDSPQIQRGPIVVDDPPSNWQGAAVIDPPPSDANSPASQAADARLSQARQEARREALRVLCDEITRRLEMANKLALDWESTCSALRTDDRGRTLAAVDNNVLFMIDVIRSSTAFPLQVKEMEQEFAVASQPILTAIGTNALQVDPQSEEYFRALLTRVNSVVEELESNKRGLDGLISSCELSPPVDYTLEQRMTVLQQERFQNLLREQAEARDEALRQKAVEESARIQQAEEERLAAEAERRIAEEEAAAAQRLVEAQQLEFQRAAAAEKARREALEAEYRRDEAEIHSLLAPFITDGDANPSVGTPGDPRTWLEGGMFGPASFGKLKGSGALDDTSDGLHRLFNFGGNGNNVRQKGGFPSYHRSGLGNPAIVARVERARELLLKYGDLLIEKGLLTP